MARLFLWFAGLWLILAAPNLLFAASFEEAFTAIGLMATLRAFLKGRPLIWQSVDMLAGAIPTVIPLWLTGLVVIAIFRRFASEA